MLSALAGPKFYLITFPLHLSHYISNVMTFATVLVDSPPGQSESVKSLSVRMIHIPWTEWNG